MTTLAPAASAANLKFPVDLSDCVPSWAFAGHGIRAKWFPAEIADARGRGVVEVSTVAVACTGRICDENADTLAEAREWLESLDYHAVVRDDESEAEYRAEEAGGWR